MLFDIRKDYGRNADSGKSALLQSSLAAMLSFRLDQWAGGSPVIRYTQMCVILNGFITWVVGTHLPQGRMPALVAHM
jgi:hypothetical protein